VEVVRRIKEIGMAVENSKVLIIVNNWGIEETELTRPLRDLKAAGAKVTLAPLPWPRVRRCSTTATKVKR
jgi:protease I